MADTSSPQLDDLAYFPSDYSFNKAVPLHYLVDRSSPSFSSQPLRGRPAPLTDLFPAFASSPIAQKTSAPIPIVQLCDASNIGTIYGREGGSTTSLSLCVLDACKEPLAQVAAAKATFEALIMATNGDTRVPGGPDLVKHFNSYNALEECTLRNCPTEYFVAHSTICVSLRHPYFVQRNIFLPALPPWYANVTSASINYAIPNGQLFSDYLTQVRTRSPPTRIGERNQVADIGMLLPTLPAGFPCDPTRMDQATGALRPPNTVGNSVPGMSPYFRWQHVYTPGGMWVTAADNSQWAMMYNASTDLGAVHVWKLKSTLFRGIDGLGARSADTLRQTLGAVPANVYSLGHCPRSTREVAGSKLAGEPCSTSIECMFSLCVNGKCAAAVSGKELDIGYMLQSMWDTSVLQKDWAMRATAAWWMWLAGGIVGGLIVVRVVQLLIWRWWVRRQRAKRGVRAREVEEPPVLEMVAAVISN